MNSWGKAATCLAFVLVVAAGGCALTEPIADPSGSGSCKGGATEPITRQELLRTLRGAGYNVYNNPGCDRSYAEWGVTNFSSLVPELAGETFDETREREGALACVLTAHAMYDPSVGIGQHEENEYVSLQVLNVNCYIYPDPEKKAEHIARFEKALSRLADSQ